MDVSVQKHAQEELQLASLVYRESAEAMMVTDEANRIVAVNPSFERITGFRSSEVVSDTPLILSSDDNNHASYRDMLERLETDHYWQGELWLKKKNGQKFAAAMTVNTTFHSNGAVNRHVTLFADVTEKKHAEEMVWQQANFDALTGLPNRRHFQDQLQQEVKHARRTGLPLALMFIDLDGFKDVNDTLGHDIGDLLLKLAAERLSSCVRETDTVGRLGGDEFTVLLSELHNVRQVSTRAQHILTRLEQPFQLGDEIAYVSGSIGITLYPQDATSMDELLVNADQAMYAAKHGGKNRYHYFTPALQEAAQERMWLANELRLAIDRKQFKLAFQPIVELASGCVNKAEALLRWEHPEKGAIDPSQWQRAFACRALYGRFRSLRTAQDDTSEMSMPASTFSCWDRSPIIFLSGAGSFLTSVGMAMIWSASAISGCSIRSITSISYCPSRWVSQNFFRLVSARADFAV
jgi:diguanylate cyclase (GGDEF)-like protein/PAS domain S-box-containing protein